MALREIELGNRLDVFGGDARACASFAFTELTLSHELRAFELARQVEAHCAFWQHVRAALRTALFAALGRIYDERRNSNSAGQVLRFCERHPELFSPTTLVARQMAAGVPRELAAQRARNAFELHTGALAPVFAELDRMRRFYHRVVQAAQARMLRACDDGAHGTDALPDELGGSDFAELAVFPLRLHRALEGLYREGRPPALAAVPTALDAILAARGAAWEHVRAARSAAAFVRSQCFAPAGLEPLAADAADYVADTQPYFARAEAGPV